MSSIRTDYYYMNADQRREYHRRKNREYRDRLAALQGRTINHRKPGSHPSQMNADDYLAYRRDVAQRYRQRQKLLANE